MKQHDSGWCRAAKGSPCPICDGNHACSVSPTGVYLCRRLRASANGFTFLREDRHKTFGVFVRDGDTGPSFWKRQAEFATARKPKPTKPKKPQAPPPNFSAILDERTATDDDVGRLAAELGVPPWTLRRLGIGFGKGQHRDRVFLFPEYDAAGNIIGVMQRLGARAKPNKVRWGGGRAGLCYVPGTIWKGDVHIVEGSSDVAAMLAMGFATVVGRPSNTGGSELLSELLGPAVKAGEAKVIVWGENDQREVADGQDPWPGKTGAMKVAKALAENWTVTVHYSFPPEGVKDMRDLWCQIQAGAKLPILNSCDWSVLSIKVQTNRKNSPRTDQSQECDVQTNRKNWSRADEAGQNESVPFGPSASRVLAEGISPIRCQSGSAPVLIKRGNPRSATSIRVGCRRLSCDICARYRRLALLVHMACVFHEHDGPLFTLAESATAFAALRQQVRVSNGDYAAVRVAGGDLRVIVSVPLVKAHPVGPAEAIELFATVLLDAETTSQRPFLFSARWKPPPRPKSDYERIGSVAGKQFAEFLDELREGGLKPVDEGERPIEGEEPRRSAHWSAPPEMTDADHRGLIGKAVRKLGGKLNGKSQPSELPNEQTNDDFVEF